jgi:hypothetical protein
MTPTPPNDTSSSPTEPASAGGKLASPPEREIGPMLLKGCGCLVASTVLAVGVAIAGRGNIESIGSALIGVLFLILVVGSSGLTGFWNKKG